jgi:hypothetical protein
MGVGGAIPPGITYFPEASIILSASIFRDCPTVLISPSSQYTPDLKLRSAVTTVQFLINNDILAPFSFLCVIIIKEDRCRVNDYYQFNKELMKTGQR